MSFGGRDTVLTTVVNQRQQILNCRNPELQLLTDKPAHNKDTDVSRDRMIANIIQNVFRENTKTQSEMSSF